MFFGIKPSPPRQQIEFSKRLGPLDQHPADDAVLPDHPEILVVSTKKEDGAFVGLPDGGPMWHSDLAYRERTSLGSMLYGIEIPEEGGDTRFANMYSAYDALPQYLKKAVTGRRGVFLAGRSNEKQVFLRNLNQTQKERTPAVTHPLIRTHPETGLKSIFANPQHTISIEGMDPLEANDILAELFAYGTKEDFIYRHKWRVGDLTFWDNRCVWHIADLSRISDPTYVRHLHRTTITGDVPV